MEMMATVWPVAISQVKASWFAVWNVSRLVSDENFHCIQHHPVHHRYHCHCHDISDLESVWRKTGPASWPWSPSSAPAWSMIMSPPSSPWSSPSWSRWPEWCLRWKRRPSQASFPAQLPFLFPAEIISWKILRKKYGGELTSVVLGSVCSL